MLVKAKFECHITCGINHATAVRAVGVQTSWKYSAFDADPLMGARPFAYLTDYGRDAQELLARAQAVGRLLEDSGVPVLRIKVERIVFDSRTGVNELAEEPR